MIREHYVTCGKQDCSCSHGGPKHGPYRTQYLGRVNVVRPLQEVLTELERDLFQQIDDKALQMAEHFPASSYDGYWAEAYAEVAWMEIGGMVRRWAQLLAAVYGATHDGVPTLLGLADALDKAEKKAYPDEEPCKSN